MASPSGMYCKTCSYDLRGQQTPRCPECGRPFDPANRRTFRREPYRAWKAWLRRLAIPAAILLLLYAAMLGWLWWGWSAEQVTIRQLMAPSPERLARGGSAEVASPRTALPLVPRLLPEQLQFLLDRASAVWVRGFATDEDLARAGRLRGLCELTADGPRLSDAGLRPLSGLTELNALNLWGDGLRGPGLVHLRPLRRLAYLSLACTARDAALEGRCLVHLAPLRNLRSLDVLSVDLSPDDLTPLAGLTRLDTLILEASKPTAVSLAPLAALPRLRQLRLRGFPLTDTQAADLARCPALELLRLDALGLHLGEPGIAALTRLTSLREVQVARSTLASPALADQLRRAFPRARVILLDGTAPPTAPAPPASATARPIAPGR